MIEQEAYEDLRGDEQVLGFHVVLAEVDNRPPFLSDDVFLDDGEDVLASAHDYTSRFLNLSLEDSEHVEEARDDGILQVLPEVGERVVESSEDLQYKCENVHSLWELHKEVYHDCDRSIHTTAVFKKLTVEVDNIFELLRDDRATSVIVHLHN